jgi:S1-C subfamily serine protease
MSELARIQLNQAQQLARAGESFKALEHLEKARVLAGDDMTLRRQVLEQLLSAYQTVGRSQDAQACRDELAQIAPPVAPPPAPGSPAPSPLAYRPAPVPVAYRPPPPPGRGSPVLIGIITVVLIAIVIAVVVALIRPRKGADWVLDNQAPATQPSPATAQAITPPTATTHPVLVLPTPVSAPPRTEVPSPPPVAPAAPVATAPTLPTVVPPIAPSAALKRDRQELLSDTVGLCVVTARYEGLIGDDNATVDIPVGIGTAFAIDPKGAMLTNRHVVEAAKEAKMPANLEEAHLPDLVLKNVSFVICFGPAAKDRYPAKLIHKSEQFDLAILKIARHCDSPLAVSVKPPRQGDDIFVCGFPGAVIAAFNESTRPARFVAMVRKWRKNHQLDALDEFSPDSFNSTLTRGIVSASDRTMDGAKYMQVDAAVSPGNSGGPVLNLDNQVVGIATWKIRTRPGDDSSGNYNFALRMDQLMDELGPYLPRHGE